MKEFYIDFSGYCIIKADNDNEARNEFWRMIQEELPLPTNFYDIEGIEEKTE